jgi:quinol monooxygenase YgiN
MIIVTLRVKVPSAKRADFMSLCESFTGPTSVQPGCRKIDVYNNINDNNELLLVEEWSSWEDLRRHVLSENFRKVLVMMDLARENPQINFHTVSSTEGFGLVERLRPHE